MKIKTEIDILLSSFDEARPHRQFYICWKLSVLLVELADYIGFHPCSLWAHFAGSKVEPLHLPNLLSSLSIQKLSDLPLYL